MKKKLNIMLMIVSIVVVAISCNAKDRTMDKQIESVLMEYGLVTDNLQNQVAKNDARALLGGSEGWSFGYYGGYNDKAWDSNALPSIFPAMPQGFQPEQTMYKGLDDDSIHQGTIGELWFDDIPFEQWGVSGYATMDQIDQIISDLVSNGMIGGTTKELSNIMKYEFYGNGYYVYITFHKSYASQEGANPYLFSMSATSTAFARITKFQGTPLPTEGMLTEVCDGILNVDAYDKDYDTIDDYHYDLQKDEGVLPEEYVFWFPYIGLSIDMNKTWVKGLSKYGWNLDWEYENDGNYSAQLRKDAMYAKCEYHSYSGYTQIAFSSMSELMWY